MRSGPVFAASRESCESSEVHSLALVATLSAHKPTANRIPNVFVADLTEHVRESL